jgi:AcrR family transcriptional regulator
VEPGELVGSRGTREIIIEAALEQFGQKSFLGATTAEIAREAGISEKTIFDLFGDKKTLYQAVRRHIRESAIRNVLVNLPIGGGAPALLRALGREFIRETRERPNTARVSMQAITAIDDPDMKQSIRDFLRQIQVLVENILIEGRKSNLIRDDIDLDQFSWTFAMALHSVAYIEIMEFSPPIDEEDALLLIDGLVRIAEAG